MNKDEFKEKAEALKEKDSFTQTVELGKQVLQELGATVSEKAKSGMAVYEEYKMLLGECAQPIPPNTFIQYLCKAAGKQGTEIFCEGHKQGYYTRVETDVVADYVVDNARVSAEKDLYPIFVNWLSRNGYASKDVATLKANGTWGNPDVVGLKVHEGIGQFQIELVTIECKKTFDGWKHWIFEAISHTRFSDRSYFAFVFPEDEIDKYATELVKYAEHFGIGVLVLEISSEEYEKFKSGQYATADEENIRIVAYARRNVPVLEDKVAFLKESLGVDSTQKLFLFGSDAMASANNEYKEGPVGRQ